MTTTTTKPPFLDVAGLAPGDSIQIGGELLDVFEVQRRDSGRIYVKTDDDRVFLTEVGARRRIVKAPPPRPTVST